MPAKRNTIAKDFDPHVFGFAARLALAADLAFDLDIDDHVDEAVVRTEIDDASLHVARAIRIVHDEWYEMRGNTQERAALRLFHKYGPAEPEPVLDIVDSLLAFAYECIECGRPGVALGWTRRVDDDRYAKVGYELDAAIEHCERVIYVLDPRAEIGIPSIPDYADDATEEEKRREAIIDRVEARRAEIVQRRYALN